VRRVLTVIAFGAALACGQPAGAAEPAGAGAPGPEAAGAAPAGGPAIYDPWQKFNRASFAVHQFLDHWFLRPAAMVYSHVVPPPLREALRNILGNLHEPVVFANDMFQGHFGPAGETVGRFAANTTLGVGGVFDVATQMGAPHHDNTFGLTLGRAHVHPGPYLFIPLMGPSTVRDAFGAVVDSALDPWHWPRYRYYRTVTETRIVVGGLDKRAQLDPDLKALLADATDPYATLRSVYLQSQQSQIDEGAPGASAVPALPDFGDQGESAPAPASAQPAPASGQPAPPPPSETPPPPSSETPPPPSGAPAPSDAPKP
jgi:phospholipid-binding lipoprotein MlaA